MSVKQLLVFYIKKTCTFILSIVLPGKYWGWLAGAAVATTPAGATPTALLNITLVHSTAHSRCVQSALCAVQLYTSQTDSGSSSANQQEAVLLLPSCHSNQLFFVSTVWLFRGFLVFYVVQIKKKAAWWRYSVQLGGLKILLHILILIFIWINFIVNSGFGFVPEVITVKEIMTIENIQIKCLFGYFE